MEPDILKKRFISLYDKEADVIFRFCLSRVSDREASLDLAQETFTKFWNTLIGGQEIKNDRALLFAIARNLVIDRYRKKKSVSLDALLEDEESVGYVGKLLGGPGRNEIEMTKEAEYMIEKINEIDEIYREVVYMRFAEDLKPKEIANLLGISQNVASVRINRGLAQLKKIMGY